MTPSAPVYLQNAQSILEQMLTAWHMPTARAHALAAELVERLQPIFVQAQHEACVPLLASLFQISLQAGAHGALARHTISDHMAAFPEADMLDVPDILRRLLEQMHQTASDSERPKLVDLMRRTQQYRESDPKTRRR